MDLRELAIQSAIDDLMFGIHKSQRKAANAHGIARSTLQERLNGRQCHAVAHQNQQRLTPEQEDFLADWILSEDLSGRPPSRVCVREMATCILRMNGDCEPLGQLWVANFVGRHPHVTGAVSRPDESSGNTMTSCHTIQALLELSVCCRVELGLQYPDLRGLDKARITQKVRTKGHTIVGY